LGPNGGRREEKIRRWGEDKKMRGVEEQKVG
jgi:hypothetical protein